MFTRGYKGYCIHGYFDRDECFVNGPEWLGWFSSYRSAQLAISRVLGAS